MTKILSLDPICFLDVFNSEPAMVDREDYPILSRYKWHLDRKGYVKSSVFGTTVKLHRMILNCPKNVQVDHINMYKLDNRKCNLRLCDNSSNQANTKKRKEVNGKKTSSKYKGVHWRKDLGKWASRISYNNKRVHLGYYDCETKAALAYNFKANEIWGEFARLNDIENGGTV
jgi:hypothetical protein